MLQPDALRERLAAAVGRQLLQPLRATCIVEVGANVQPGQVGLDRRASRGGAARPRDRRGLHTAAAPVFVDPWYFDPYVKRVRASSTPAEDTLDFVPVVVRRRGCSRSARRTASRDLDHARRSRPASSTASTPRAPARTSCRSLKENFEVINARTTNWTRRPVADAAVGAARPPGPRRRRGARAARGAARLRAAASTSRTRVAAWTRARRRSCTRSPASASTRCRFDALHFEGPGTDLTVGLLPTLALRAGRAGMHDRRRHRPRAEPPDRGGLRRRRTRCAPTGVVALDEAARRRDGDDGPRPRGSLRGRPRGRDRRRRERRGAARPRRRGTRVRRGSARSRSSTARAASAARHGLLQHAARRERREPPRAREGVRRRPRRRGRSRAHQQERDPHRLHDRQRRRRRSPATHARRRREVPRARRPAAGSSERATPRYPRGPRARALRRPSRGAARRARRTAPR